MTDDDEKLAYKWFKIGYQLSLYDSIKERYPELEPLVRNYIYDAHLEGKYRRCPILKTSALERDFNKLLETQGDEQND